MSLCFVTVTYWNDFDLLDRLLASMEKYVTTRYTHCIVLNDSDQHLNELQQVVNKYKFHDYKVILFSEMKTQYPDLVMESPTKLGWRTQQVLKLAIARYVDTEFYCVLDSKDFFIRKCDPATAFFLDGKPITYPEVESINEEFHVYFKQSHKVFGIEGSKDRSMRSHTPFTMKTLWVNNMLDYFLNHNMSLIALIDGDFDPTVLHGNRCVEFYLYNAWLKLNNLLDQYVWQDNFCHLSFSNKERRPE